MPPSLYPLLLEPHLSRPIWGGSRLSTQYGKGSHVGESVGESWEIFEGDRIINGRYAGRTLKDLAGDMPSKLLGSAAINSPPGRFPLLIKLIDAAQQLSIQVHPNDAQAQELERQPFGKTEAWYILDAAPGAQLVYGLAHALTPDELRERALSGAIEADLGYLTVSAGDVVLVPAGTIHAIGAGIFLYEIQQTSDTTYRLYDWNRRGPDGQLRELHVEKAVCVATLVPTHGGVQQVRELEAGSGVRRTELVRSAYFALERLILGVPWEGQFDKHSFVGITCIEGDLRLAAPDGSWPTERLAPGSSALLPADLASCRFEPWDGTATALIASLPSV